MSEVAVKLVTSFSSTALTHSTAFVRRGFSIQYLSSNFPKDPKKKSYMIDQKVGGVESDERDLLGHSSSPKW